MVAHGMSSPYISNRPVTWGEVPSIYKARFRKLWLALRLSLLAAAITLATVVLLPLIFGIAIFKGHLTVATPLVALALLLAAWLFWMSLKLAFNFRS